MKKFHKVTSIFIAITASVFTGFIVTYAYSTNDPLFLIIEILPISIIAMAKRNYSAA